MNAPVAIGRLHTRLHTPAELLPRAQAVQQLLLDEVLEPRLLALAPDDELVLIRRIALSLAIPAQHTDYQAAQQWGDAIARAVQCELDSGHHAWMVRFRHHGMALQALSEAALAGDDRQDWVWRRLGWLPSAAAGGTASDEERREALFNQLQTMPQWAASLLQGWHAAQCLLPRLSALTQAERLQLWAALYAACGRSAPLPWEASAPTARVSAPAEGLAVRTSTPPVPASLQAMAVASLAAWGENWREALSALPGPQAAILAAIRLWLDVPAIGYQPAASLQARVAAIVQLARQEAETAPDEVMVPDTATPMQPTAAPPPSLPNLPETDPVPADRASGTQTDPRCGFTDYGGLLLLPPLLESSGALACLLSVADTSLPAALARLAGELLPPLNHSDPARLAFAGLPPDAEPPYDWREAATPGLAAALLKACQCLLDGLADRLPQWAGPALVARVAQRTAEIRHDPGWIDVCFRLEDVCLEIRRAGLDLDPGYLPFLGLVMRYRYA